MKRRNFLSSLVLAALIPFRSLGAIFPKKKLTIRFDLNKNLMLPSLYKGSLEYHTNVYGDFVQVVARVFHKNNSLFCITSKVYEENDLWKNWDKITEQLTLLAGKRYYIENQKKFVFSQIEYPKSILQMPDTIQS